MFDDYKEDPYICISVKALSLGAELPPAPPGSFMESSSRPQEVAVQLCGLEEPGAAAGSEICLEEFQTADLL
jgi:hypothetical protein